MKVEKRERNEPISFSIDRIDAIKTNCIEAIIDYTFQSDA